MTILKTFESPQRTNKNQKLSPKHGEVDKMEIKLHGCHQFNLL